MTTMHAPHELADLSSYDDRSAYDDAFATEPGLPAESRPASGQSYESAVALETQRMRVRAAARARFEAETAPTLEPFDVDTLGGVLGRAPMPPFRIERLVPPDAGTLLSAMRKSGKTTFALNLAKCLLTGESFLGEFEVQPIDGDVAFLNFEVSASTVADWAERVGLDHNRLHLVNLRGRSNPLASIDDRGRLAEILRSRGIETVVVDPFTRAFTGDDQNSASQVGPFLSALDVFVRRDIGARDLILTAHTGWDAERSRGSSELEGWADSIIRLVKGRDGDSSRYIRAEGRDVDLEEQQLAFDPETHRLALTGNGSRTAARTSEHIPAVLAVLSTTEGRSGKEIETALRGSGIGTSSVRAALDAAWAQGLTVRVVGPRNSTLTSLKPEQK